jgi:hypothetical protein
LAIRLYAVHLPSPTQSAWQVALVETAARAGWDVVSLVPGQDPTVRDDVNALIQGTDANLIPAGAPHAVILTGSPQAGVDTLMQIHEMDRKTALNSVAWWFAQAAEATAAGNVAVLNAAAPTLAIPSLGEVTRAEGALVKPTGFGEPLAFYETLPPAIGASAAWPMSILTWENEAEPGATDLTGKRRLIQFGPYLLLSSGTWTAELVFELSIERAITELRFDWGDGVDVTSVSQRITAAGVYSVTLTKSWDRPTTTELRIWLDRSMFDGSLKVLSTKITRTA